MSRPRVVVFDYGSGNLRSAQRALEHAGAEATVTADVAIARKADGMMLPGVGAFATCMSGLLAAHADEVVNHRVATGLPVLGVCVGAQVLFESGDEHGVVTPGFAMFTGAVTRLNAVTVPHMGWNTVDSGTMSLFDGIASDARFYFVHSYAARPPVADADVAITDHGGGFIAAVSRGPLSATQFHPEKSGRAGLTLLSNWVRSL